MKAERTAVRCGVAGVGYLGRHHARIYRELARCELVGVYDLDEERAREVAGDHGCRVFSSLEALGESCEAVSVVVPTDRHCEVALALLVRGCHLLIEKPLCTTVQEAEAIMQSARGSERVVQVGHVEHFNPVMKFLESAVSDPRYITADRLAPFAVRGSEVGVVLDLMIHDIGVILALVRSPVSRVEGVGVSVLSEREDIANARIVFENGCVANINTSRVSAKKVREIRVFQPSAYISLDFMDQSGHLMRKEGAGLSREEIPIEKGEPLFLEIESFVDCVDRRDQPRVGTSLGMSALEIALQITGQIDRL